MQRAGADAAESLTATASVGCRLLLLEVALMPALLAAYPPSHVREFTVASTQSNTKKSRVRDENSC